MPLTSETLRGKRRLARPIPATWHLKTTFQQEGAKYHENQCESNSSFRLDCVPAGACRANNTSTDICLWCCGGSGSGMPETMPSIRLPLCCCGRRKAPKCPCTTSSNKSTRRPLASGPKSAAGQARRSRLGSGRVFVERCLRQSSRGRRWVGHPSMGLLAKIRVGFEDLRAHPCAEPPMLARTSERRHLGTSAANERLHHRPPMDAAPS